MSLKYHDLIALVDLKFNRRECLWLYAYCWPYCILTSYFTGCVSSGASFIMCLLSTVNGFTTETTDFLIVGGKTIYPF